MTYTDIEKADKKFVVTELDALKDMKNELYEKITRYNSALSVPESLYGQMDQLNDQIKELEEALEEVINS